MDDNGHPAMRAALQTAALLSDLLKSQIAVFERHLARVRPCQMPAGKAKKPDVTMRLHRML